LYKLRRKFQDNCKMEEMYIQEYIFIIYLSRLGNSIHLFYCASSKGKPTVLRMEEESERNVACHPYYLTYMENL